MDCNKLRQPSVLVSYLRSENKTDVDRALICFHELWYNLFKRLGMNRCLAKSYARYKSNELTDDAFNRGLLSFYLKIKKDGFEERGATVETAFISFCLLQLKGVMKTEERYAEKITGTDPSLIFEKKENEDESISIAIKNEEEVTGKNERLFQKAFAALGERCQELIRWRKLGQFTNEEIALKFNLQPSSVNNEVFKCMEKLKKMINDPAKKN